MEALDLPEVMSERSKVVLVGGEESWYPSIETHALTDDLNVIIKFMGTKSDLRKKIESDMPDLVLLHDRMNIFWNGDLEFLHSLRMKGYQGSIAILTNDPSCEDLIEALRSGVDEYLYIGPNLNLTAEIKRLLMQPDKSGPKLWNPEAIAQMGFVRSIGLTSHEIQILVEFARDFPRLHELASRLQKSETYVRKCFSQIYAKLQDTLAIDNQAQLSRLLTICVVGLEPIPLLSPSSEAC